jgi:rhodanese-related sulfurtransferase
MQDPEPLEIAFESLDEAVADGFVIIDIREPYEVADMPTPSGQAQHIPMGQLLHHDSEPLDASQRYLLVCASGRRSLAAAAELRARGIEGAFSLPGGVHALAPR